MPASALDALDTVAVRAFAALRLLNVLVLLGYVLVWRGWYADHPVALAAVAVTAGWGVAFVVVSLRRGPPAMGFLAAGSFVLALVMSAGAALWVPELSVGGFGTWVFATATHASVVASWAYRRRMFAAMIAAMVAALAGGAGIAHLLADDPAAGGNSTPLGRVAIGVVLLTGLATLFRLAIGRLRGIALDADARLRTAAAERRVAAVAAARLRAEHERERMLHDTVLNTLTGIAWGGAREPGRSGRAGDGDGRDPEGGSRTSDGKGRTSDAGGGFGPGRERPTGAEDGSARELTVDQCRYAIEAVRAMLDGSAPGSRDLASEMVRVLTVARARGLRVDVRALPTTELPAEVVRALAAATMELLTNVRRHAGTDRAALEVYWRPGIAGEPLGEVAVIVSDEGVGFAVSEVPADRLGLARSVHERMAEIGAQVTITSEPGRGTTALLHWPEPAGHPTAGRSTAGRSTAWHPTAEHGTAGRGLVPAHRPVTAGRRVGGSRRWWPTAASRFRRGHRAGGASVAPVPSSGPAGSSAAELRDSYAAVLRRTVAVVAAVWFGCTVVVLIALLHTTRSAVWAVLAWLVLGVAVLGAARVSYRRPLRSGEALGLITLALAVTVAAGLNLAPIDAAADGATADGGQVSRINAWPVLVLPVLLALVAVSRLFVEWIAALVATVVVLDVLVLNGAGTGPLALAQLLAATNGQIALQLLVAMGGPVLRRTADQVAQAVEEESVRAGLEQSAEAVRADRERGLATIEREVLPLLDAVASGLLDPRDPAVRDRCARHATAIRRTLVSGETAALADLARPVYEARARGLELEVQVAGELRRAPAGVRAQLAGALPQLLATATAAGARRAVLTLICDEAGGRLFLIYPAAAPPADAAGAGAADSPGTTERAESREPVEAPGPAKSTEATDSAGLVSVSTDLDDGQVCVEVVWPPARQYAAPG